MQRFSLIVGVGMFDFVWSFVHAVFGIIWKGSLLHHSLQSHDSLCFIAFIWHLYKISLLGSLEHRTFCTPTELFQFSWARLLSAKNLWNEGEFERWEILWGSAFTLYGINSFTILLFSVFSFANFKDLLFFVFINISLPT